MTNKKIQPYYPITNHGKKLKIKELIKAEQAKQFQEIIVDTVMFYLSLLVTSILVPTCRLMALANPITTIALSVVPLVIQGYRLWKVYDTPTYRGSEIWQAVCEKNAPEWFKQYKYFKS